MKKGCDFLRYVISDIHGCYREYLALLKKINFSDSDYLYVLGDAVDKGSNPMDVLKDLMRRNNVTFIIGNHDFLFSHFLKKADTLYATLEIKHTWRFMRCIYRMAEFLQQLPF